MNTSNWLRLGAVAMTCALSACGGSGSDPADSVQVSADRNSVALIALNSSPMSTEPVYFTISGGKGTYYVSAAADNDTFQFEFEAVSDTEGEVTAWATTDIPAGTRHSGHITYRMCTDQQCNHVAWSRAIPYTMTRYSVDTTPLSLAGSEGASPSPVTLAVAPADTDHQLTFTSSNTAVVTADHTDPTHVVLTLPPQGMGVHTYSADISIGFQTALSAAPGQADIPLSLTIGSGLTAPAIAALNVTAASTSASLAGQAPVAFSSSQNAAWSVSSDRDWLVLDTATGTGAGSIAYHVDTARLASIANWGSDTATLTITAVGMTPVSAPVTLNMRLPEITTVTPSGVPAGQATTVRVTGRGLGALASVSAISVGGAAPVGGSIDSDTAATLQLPAMVAGTVNLSAPNNLGRATVSAALGVMPAGSFSAAMVANIGTKGAIAFDATRNALFATNQDDNTLLRFQLVGSQWQTSSLPISGTVRKLALSPDRRTVYVTAASSLVEVDPDTMQATATITPPIDLTGNTLFGPPVPMTNNLRLWFGTWQWSGLTYFDMRIGTFGSQDLSQVGANAALYGPSFYATPDGSAMMLANCNCLSPPLPNLWYDTATDSALAKASEPMVYQDVQFDDSGSRMLVDGHALYRTDTMALIGDAALAAGVQAGGGVISPDGTRIYREVYDMSDALNNDIIVDHIEVFDATSVVAAQSTFTDLGAIALPDKATGGMSAHFVADYAGRLALDPTGTTLFWAGQKGFVVVPVPSAMSGIAHAGRAHATDASRMRSAMPASTQRALRADVRGHRAH